MKKESESGLERHLRHKFAIELFISRQGFPIDLDFLPSDCLIDAWKVCYLLKEKDLDGFYVAELQKNSKAWKELECQVLHIPKEVVEKGK